MKKKLLLCCAMFMHVAHMNGQDIAARITTCLCAGGDCGKKLQEQAAGKQVQFNLPPLDQEEKSDFLEDINKLSPYELGLILTTLRYDIDESTSYSLEELDELAAFMLKLGLALKDPKKNMVLHLKQQLIQDFVQALPNTELLINNALARYAEEFDTNPSILESFIKFYYKIILASLTISGLVTSVELQDLLKKSVDYFTATLDWLVVNHAVEKETTSSASLLINTARNKFKLSPALQAKALITPEQEDATLEQENMTLARELREAVQKRRGKTGK